MKWFKRKKRIRFDLNGYPIWVKGLRLRNNLSQQKLADMAGVSQVTISAIETNKLIPSIGTQLKILKSLNYSIKIK